MGENNNIKKKPATQFPKSRTIMLGDIDSDNINNIIHNIYEIWEEDEKKRGFKKPIKLIINSTGGEVYSALALIDIIESSKTPIHTICVGSAMSAAFLIFIKGHKRIAGSRATFMYHDISSDIYGDVTHISRELNELHRLINITDQIVFEKTTLDLNYLNIIREKRQDKYFTIEEACEYNIIDEILNNV